MLRRIVREIRADIACVFERDPAARNALEVLFLYPGLHALWAYRLAHALWRRGLRLPARAISHLARWITGIEIHPAATIGPGLLIDHGMGVVIGETAEVGAGVTLYHGVTLGGTSLEKGKRHPTLGDRVVVGAGAKILGPITVGHDSRVGANAVVVREVPDNAVVTGVPGRIIKRTIPHTSADQPDLQHQQMPDVTVQTLQQLLARIEVLERHVNGHLSHPHPDAFDSGIWHDQDFVI